MFWDLPSQKQFFMFGVYRPRNNFSCLGFTVPETIFHVWGLPSQKQFFMFGVYRPRNNFSCLGFTVPETIFHVWGLPSQKQFLCPPNRRWGTYCFWCGSRRRRRPRRRPRPRSFFLTRYLLNQWMDFDQTCIDTWLGGGKELIRFW